MAKAPASGITLGYGETCVVKGMLARGDRQHDIASYFGANGGRIANDAGNYPNAQAAPEADLPPEGPYLTKYAVQSIIATLNEAIAALDLAEQENELADVKAAILIARDTIQQKIDALKEV
jgi:hypothetical protein